MLACLSVHYVYVWFLKKPEDGVGCPGTGATDTRVLGIKLMSLERAVSACNHWDTIIILCMYVCGVCAHMCTCHACSDSYVEVKRQGLRVGSLLLWVLKIEHRWSGFLGNCFYLFSHLYSPLCVGFFFF